MYFHSIKFILLTLFLFNFLNNLGTINDNIWTSHDFKVVRQSEIHSKLLESSFQFVRCIIYAKNKKKILNVYKARAAILVSCNINYKICVPTYNLKLYIYFSLDAFKG